MSYYDYGEVVYDLSNGRWCYEDQIISFEGIQRFYNSDDNNKGDETI